jgi:hypothetical protein
MTKFRIVALALLITLLAFPAAAQQKCEGPQELCVQILQLQSELESQKKLSSEVKTMDEKQVATLREQQKAQELATVKFIGAMSTLAVVLKIVLSLLTTWKDSLFKSDRGKAGIRIAILAITLGIFLATNMGFGIPWWQAMILAAGGPLSMVIHEMMKLVPVLRGKGKLPADAEAKPEVAAADPAKSEEVAAADPAKSDAPPQ